MDFCFFIPIVFGCPTKISQSSSETRVCPRCHNASCVPATSKRRFELCWIPILPLGKKEIWFCGICQWSGPKDAQFQPQQVSWNPAAQFAQPPPAARKEGYNPSYQ
ncbi:hypothetical protein BT69DRAFT_1255246 [Atractiella rhizophila]|nr:hypothetical protein BT69DRAFT_1255246 [Atractiella rhizophila]